MADNMLLNPYFAADADEDGLADGWEFAPGGARDKMEVSFARERLDTGRFAQRIMCTRFEGGHVMICQLGSVKVIEGRWYECSLRYRGENLDVASVGLHDTNGWRHLGLWKSFSPRRYWRTLRVRFQADHTAAETTRFQIWFTSTGTLWIADVSIREVPAPPPANVIPDVGHKNLLPNAGFEALGGWGMAHFWTYGWNVAPHKGLEGSHCAAIVWRPDDPKLGYYFDYFDPVERPLDKPFLHTLGYIPIKPSQIYTLSVYMRANKAGVPAILAFRGPGMWGEKKIKLTTEWERYSLTAKASGELVVPQIGPDFAWPENKEFAGCVTYLDNAQLEAAAEPTEFSMRPLEIFAPPIWQPCIHIAPQNISLEPEIVSATMGNAILEAVVTGLSDETVGKYKQNIVLKPGLNTCPISLRVPGPGYYRVRLSVRTPSQRAETSVRSLVFLPPPTASSPFGLNHAYAYEGQLELAKQIGILWVRDWSLKWEHVEPQKGQFTFEKADFQINRPLKIGMNVLCMFPFPSSEWASTAPAELKTSDYPGNRIRQAYAPQNPRDLENYVAHCVARYKSRIRHWEVFNESIFTNYSLPHSAGYKPEDYVPLLQHVWQGCKQTDPSCFVIGGYSAPPHMLELYKPMFTSGGLRFCDAVSIHWYPGEAPEGISASLQRLQDLMRAQGSEKPLWMTEFAYYADDDPDPIKRGWPSFVESEWLQAVWNMRACVLMLANGVEKIFYHIWPTRLNSDIGSLIFFEYAGAPRKIAATQAALSYFLGEKPRCVYRAPHFEEDKHLYLFASPPYLKQPGRQLTYVAVVWAEGEASAGKAISGARYFNCGGTPLTGKSIPIGEAPLFALLTAPSATAAARELQKSLHTKDD